MANGTGYIRLYRGTLEHVAFAREPFTQREAWLWLIERAAWRDGVQPAGRVSVRVRRGQLAAPVRYLAKAWQWPTGNVVRFLDHLGRLEMVSSAIDPETRITVVTITNYDTYQGDGTDDERNANRNAPGTQNGTLFGTLEPAETKALPGMAERDLERKLERKIEEHKKEESIDHRFEQWWFEVPRKVGKGQARQAFKGALKKAGSLSVLVDGIRRYATSVQGREPHFIAHPSTWLRGERWLDDLPAMTSASTNTSPSDFDREWAEAKTKGPAAVEAFLAKHRDAPEPVSGGPHGR